MRLMHPWMLRILLAAVLLFAGLVWYLRRKGKRAYQGGIRIGNASIVRNLAEFKRLSFMRTVLLLFTAASLVGASGAAVFLASRPYRTQRIGQGVKKRDVFLCLDVSYSLYDLNYDVVDYLQEIVDGLEGDRIGISMFNTSSVIYVPMTDDYEFIRMMLDDLKEYFRMQNLYVEKYSEYSFYEQIPYEEREEYDRMYEKLTYFEAGTLVHNETKGSSLVGEGLATCLFSFPQLEGSERTRAVILVTDNEELSRKTPVIRLDEAAGLCRDHDIRLYSIAPDRDYENAYEAAEYDRGLGELRQASEKTGGQFFLANDSSPASLIVSKIQEIEAKTISEISIVRQVDQPEIPAVVLFVCVILSLGTGMVLRRW